MIFYNIYLRVTKLFIRCSYRVNIIFYDFRMMLQCVYQDFIRIDDAVNIIYL